MKYIILILIIGLTGCTKEVSVELPVKTYRPSRSLTAPVKIPPPPRKSIYKNSKAIDRETYLSKYIIKLLGVAALSNKKLSTIGNFYDNIESKKNEL